MAIVQFSDRDILRDKIVDPGWYRVKIETVGESAAKDAPGKTPSTNYPVEATILFNGDTGDVTFRNVPVSWNFNSKAVGFAVGYLKAFGIEVKAGQRFDLKASENLELDVYVENDTYNNRIVNRVNHKYRPANKEVVAIG
jgi:hypothetical protein